MEPGEGSEFGGGGRAEPGLGGPGGDGRLAAGHWPLATGLSLALFPHRPALLASARLVSLRPDAHPALTGVRLCHKLRGKRLSVKRHKQKKRAIFCSCVFSRLLLLDPQLLGYDCNHSFMQAHTGDFRHGGRHVLYAWVIQGRDHSGDNLFSRLPAWGRGWLTWREGT